MRHLSTLALVMVSSALMACSGSQEQATSASIASTPSVSQRNSPTAIRCNDRQTWHKALGAESKAGVGQIFDTFAAQGVKLDEGQRKRLARPLRSVVMWRLVRNLLIAGNYNNLGSVRLRGLRTDKGRQVVLYRSGFTPNPAQPGSCFDSLVQSAGVRHVVNLYAGPMATEDLEAAERQVIKSVKGRYFSAREADESTRHWREHLRDAKDDATRRDAMKALARIINENILRPGGAAPEGNVQVHCGGGMHRTGMLVGILERCLNQTDMAVIERDYKRHVGWRSAEQPGGFESENIGLISSFDCTLLKLPGSPAT